MTNELVFHFTSADEFSAIVFCNQFGGGYQATPDGLYELRGAELTQADCGRAKNAYIDRLIDVLVASEFWRVEGDLLEIGAESGISVTFTRR